MKTGGIYNWREGVVCQVTQLGEGLKCQNRRQGRRSGVSVRTKRIRDGVCRNILSTLTNYLKYHNNTTTAENESCKLLMHLLDIVDF